MSTDFFSFCVNFLFVPSVHLFLSPLEDFLSRQAIGIFSPWGLRSRLVIFLTIGVRVLGFPCHKEDTVINIPQHGAVILCVSGLNRLFLHLQEKLKCCVISEKRFLKMDIVNID